VSAPKVGQARCHICLVAHLGFFHVCLSPLCLCLCVYVVVGFESCVQSKQGIERSLMSDTASFSIDQHSCCFHTLL